MRRPARSARTLLVPALTWILGLPALLGAQSVSGLEEDLLREVMPRAERFEPEAGDPPVLRAYRADELVGFVFLTENVPPEQLGYSGPVQALVGLALDGEVTGARVTEYYESYRSSMGDFLRRPGVQEQFAGKSLVDPFQVNGDVERVTRATISTQALARGIRDASRRVAEAYADEMAGALEAGPVVLEEMSWFDMRRRGVLKRILIESDEGHLDISMAHLPDDSIAGLFLGEENVPRIHAQAQRWEIENPRFVMYALEGPRLRFFLRDNWRAAQGGDTLELAYEQVYNLGLTDDDEGRVGPESVLAGVFMLDERLDFTRPFSLLYELEGHEGYYAVDFEALEEAEAVAVAASPEEDAEVAVAASPGEDAAEAVGEPGEEPDGVETQGEEEAADEADAGGLEGDTASADTAATSGIPSPPAIDFTGAQEESELQATLARTDWGKVGRLGVVVALALLAFFLKRPAVRWLSLGATLVVLGFLDAGFLSVSHLTAGIWVGPGVFLRDLPLLILAVVTVVTTLVWGRVFCGFLCPFGALQDVLERVVPGRWRVRIPWSAHRSALKVKYVVLAVILGSAVLGSQASLYQYAEPFGTVFFPSRSVLLWAIAGAFLVGAALIPRFYCRYACPLGAGLALVSFLSPRRIGRVEQCGHCRVCEQDCPTGAIEGPDIGFVECVRCNRCETNLIREAGVCRHDMERVRPRLVQIQVHEESRAGV